MKIKVIDLLNKIANGEEPKIKYDNHILKYNKNEEKFIDKDGLNSLYEIDFSELNDEVEIIEETKKIEKIARCDSIKMTYYGELHKPTENEEILRIKVNELIDEINNLKGND